MILARMTKISQNRTFKPWVLGFLIFFVVASSLFDIVTFLCSPKHMIFEANPLYHLTGLWWAPVALKVVCVIALVVSVTYLFKKYNPIVSYALVLACLYVVLFQVSGGLMNLNVSSTIPNADPEMVLPPDVAVREYTNTFVWPYVFGVFMSVTAFWVHRTLEKG